MTITGETSGSIEFESFRFNGGESHVKIKHESLHGEKIRITHRICNGDDIMLLLLSIDALERLGVFSRDITLLIPYLPYARQDRVMVTGEAFSLHVFCRILNGLNLGEVEVYDPHSDVGPALIDRCNARNNFSTVRRYISSISLQDFIFISPDAGAYKKTSKLGQEWNAEVVIASKKRDVNTGALSGCQIHGDVTGKTCLIVDDICDGGRTFLQLGDALTDAGASELHLFVSHGIFSNGYDELRKRFKTIGTTDSFQETYPDFITTIKL